MKTSDERSVERLEHAPCGFVEFTDDGNITYANATLVTMLGYLPGELPARKFETLLTVANRIFHQTHFFPLLKLHGSADEIFLSLLARNGDHVPVVASARRIQTSGEALTQCVFVTVRQRRKYEDEILQARRTAEAALKNNEQLKLLQGKLEENARHLEQRLRQLEARNEELRHVSQILSHDLREPMRKVRLFADLVRETAGQGLDAEGTAAVQRIFQESDRAEALISSIQRFLGADMSMAPDETVGLNAVIEAAAWEVRKQFAEWTLEMEPLPSVEGQTSQLQQMFTELLENAVKFRDPARPLRVRVTGRVIQQNRYQVTRDRYEYVDFVQVEVSDNGSGFDPKYQTYVFHLLKKIDLQSPGFGIGLALCRKIAERHCGTISVESQPGVGTTFVVRLPVVQ